MVRPPAFILDVLRFQRWINSRSLFELLQSRATVEGLLGQWQAVGNTALCSTRGDRCCGIEQDDVPLRHLLTAQESQRQLGIECRIATPYGLRAVAWQPKILRLHRIGLYFAVP